MQLTDVLRGGRQCDEDGTEIIMSRQACHEAANEIERLNLELQKRDKCSFMGPMRDCPTHGDSKDAARYRWLRDQMFFTKREWGTFAELPDGMVFAIPATAEAWKQNPAIDKAVDIAMGLLRTPNVELTGVPPTDATTE